MSDSGTNGDAGEASTATSLRIDRGAPRRRSGGGMVWILAVGFVVLAAWPAWNWMTRARSLVSGTTVREGLVVRMSASASAEQTTASGYVVARTRAAVSPRRPGKLARLLVDVADVVEKGQLLAELEHQEEDAAVARARTEVERAAADVTVAEASAAERRDAAEKASRDLESARASKEEVDARLVDAEREYKRLEALVKDRIVTVSERDQAQTAFRVAKALVRRADAFVRSAEAEQKRARSDVETFVARVESARLGAATAAARLKEAEEFRDIAFIRAPFAGKVLRKEAEVGEVIAPAATGGQSTRGALLTLADFQTLEMEVDVFERDVSLVEEDSPARIVLDAYPKVVFPGRVRQVVPTADRQKATVQVKVSFNAPDDRVLPEMGGKVVFLAAGSEASDEPDRVWVPGAAVVERAGRQGVFLLVKESAEMRVRFTSAETGMTKGSNVEVKSGLKGGERVVLDPSPTLKDGDLVSVGTP